LLHDTHRLFVDAGLNALHFIYFLVCPEFVAYDLPIGFLHSFLSDANLQLLNPCSVRNRNDQQIIDLADDADSSIVLDDFKHIVIQKHNLGASNQSEESAKHFQQGKQNWKLKDVVDEGSRVLLCKGHHLFGYLNLRNELKVQ